MALAVLWGFSLTVGAFVAAGADGGRLTLVTAGPASREDTGIGLLFVGMLALGVVIVSKVGSFTTDVRACSSATSSA